MVRLLKFLSVFLISIFSLTVSVYATEMNYKVFETHKVGDNLYGLTISPVTMDDYKEFYNSFDDSDGILKFKNSDISKFSNKKLSIMVSQRNSYALSNEVNQVVENIPKGVTVDYAFDFGDILNLKKFYFVGVNVNKPVLLDQSAECKQIVLTFGNVSGSCNIKFNMVGWNNSQHTSFAKYSLNDNVRYLFKSDTEIKPKPKPKPKPIPKPKLVDDVPPHITGDIDIKSGNGVLDGIVNVIKGFFKVLAFWGKKIIAIAIGIGIIFVGAKWLWRKLREWLNSM